MPRALDAKQITWDNDPNRGIEFHLGSFQQIDQLIQMILDGLVTSLELLIIPAIEEFLGIDLSALKPLLETLHLDCSSPEAFLTSIVNTIVALPELLITLIISLIESLISSVGSDSMPDLISGIIDLILSLPELLIQLAESLLTQFTSLVGIDFSSPEGLLGGLLGPLENIFLHGGTVGGGTPTESNFPLTFPFDFAAGFDHLPYTLPFTLGATAGSTSIGSFFTNLQSFLSSDFSAPGFDLTTAVETFIGTTLEPTGLLASGLDLQELIDTMFGALTGSSGTGNLLTDLFNSLLNIPSGNVTGVGGPANIGGSVTSTWDQLIGGLVGSLGSGAGLADVFNISQDISSRATLGQMGWGVLGIRSNKPVWSGLLPTGVSNIPMPLHTSTAPTFALTQSTATTSFHRIDESGTKGAVSWNGSGTTSITSFFINIFQMDSAGAMTLVHSSPDIIGSVSSPLGTNVYTLQDGSANPTPIDVVAGETYGIELAVRGAGTHNIVGAQTWLPNHPSVFPRNLAAVRNSGTSAPPSTIATGSVSYSNNVAFVEFAVAPGEYDNHDPQTTLFNTVGSTSMVIPSWATYVDVIAVGSGKGGTGASFFIYGVGGVGGVWATATWTRTTDFTGTPTISITIPAGGAGGTGSGGNGGNGAAAVASITGHTVTAAGATTSNTVFNGLSPGNLTYNGVTYVGGGTQNTAGLAGAAPGGGGGGGNYVTNGPGGAGGAGAVWIVARQT